jgi:predicted RNA-binding protein YlqC (UPF0109 family)
MKGLENLKAFVTEYVYLLTAKPELITIDVKETPKTVVIDVNSTDNEEIAKLVGRNGTIVKSMRRLIYPIGKDFGKTVVFNVSEVDEKPEGAPTLKELITQYKLDKYMKEFPEKVKRFVTDFARLRYDSFVEKTGKLNLEFPKINILITDANRIIVEIAGDSQLVGYIVGKRKAFLKHLRNILKFAAIKEQKETGKKYIITFYA